MESSKLVIWDLRPGRLPLRTLPQAGRIAEFSADGMRLALGGSNGVWLCDGGTLDYSGTFLAHTGTVKNLSFSKAGALVVGLEAGDVGIWELGEITPKVRWLADTNKLTLARLSSDGRILATLHTPARLRFWDRDTEAALTPLMDVNAGLTNGAGDRSLVMQFSPDGSQLVVGTYRGPLVLYETGRTNRIVREWHKGPVSGVIFSRDGRWMATSSFDASVQIWDAITGVPRFTNGLHADHNIMSFDFSGDGRWLAAGTMESRTLFIWDAGTGKLVRQIEEHAGMAHRLAFNPDGLRLASASQQGMIQIWDTRTGLPVDEPIKPPGARTSSLAWSTDGRRLLIGLNTETVCAVDVPEVPIPAPAWLAGIAEALVGEVDENSPGQALLDVRTKRQLARQRTSTLAGRSGFSATVKNGRPHPSDPRTGSA
jgi:WD40 repeat protein